MIYGLVKSLHIVAVIVWIGTMFAAAMHTGRAVDPEILRRWRIGMTVSMGLTWAAGLYLALSAGWFASGWLMTKLVFVVILSAYHGILTGQLRRAAGAGEVFENRWATLIIAAIVSCTVLLAVTKTF